MRASATVSGSDERVTAPLVSLLPTALCRRVAGEAMDGADRPIHIANPGLQRVHPNDPRIHVSAAASAVDAQLSGAGLCGHGDGHLDPFRRDRSLGWRRVCNRRLSDAVPSAGAGMAVAVGGRCRPPLGRNSWRDQWRDDRIRQDAPVPDDDGSPHRTQSRLQQNHRDVRDRARRRIPRTARRGTTSAAASCWESRSTCSA